MAIVVETGTGSATSNSYVSVVTADAYWLARNGTEWAAATTTVKEAALLAAAQYLDYKYLWINLRTHSLQAMAWPRFVAYYDDDGRQLDSNTVPQRVLDAQCILANDAVVNGVGPLDSQERGGRIQSEGVGPLAVSYFADAPSGKRFPLVDALVRDLVRGSAAFSDAARA